MCHCSYDSALFSPLFFRYPPLVACEGRRKLMRNYLPNGIQNTLTILSQDVVIMNIYLYLLPLANNPYYKLSLIIWILLRTIDLLSKQTLFLNTAKSLLLFMFFHVISFICLLLDIKKQQNKKIDTVSFKYHHMGSMATYYMMSDTQLTNMNNVILH